MSTRDEKEQSKETSISLSDDDIKVTRQRERRSFLKAVGLGVVGVAALVAAPRVTARDDDPSDGRDSDTADNGGHQSNFPKGSSDGDETVNKDLKASDSDDNNSKETDSDENRLRDVKRSTDSD